MNRWEMLRLFSEIGEEREHKYDSDLEGYFKWEVHTDNGELEFTITFYDIPPDGDPEDPEAYPVYSYSWALDTTEAESGGDN